MLKNSEQFQIVVNLHMHMSYYVPCVVEFHGHVGQK